MAGYDACATFQPTPGAPPDWRERLFRAAYRNGLSVYNNLYITFSHSDADIADALERWDRVCRELAP